jgi:hypothetical protein
MTGLLVVGLLLTLLNAAAARFASAWLARNLFWASTASPAILLLIYSVAATSVWDLGGAVYAGTWALVMLVPAMVGAGAISLLGQFFGRLAKGDFL